MRRTLTLEGIIVNKYRPKHNFTIRNLTRILLTLRTRNDLIFIPEHYLVQTTFIVHAHYWIKGKNGLASVRARAAAGQAESVQPCRRHH